METLLYPNNQEDLQTLYEAIKKSVHYLTKTVFTIDNNLSIDNMVLFHLDTLVGYNNDPKVQQATQIMVYLAKSFLNRVTSSQKETLVNYATYNNTFLIQTGDEMPLLTVNLVKKPAPSLDSTNMRTKATQELLGLALFTGFYFTSLQTIHNAVLNMTKIQSSLQTMESIELIPELEKLKDNAETLVRNLKQHADNMLFGDKGLYNIDLLFSNLQVINRTRAYYDNMSHDYDKFFAAVAILQMYNAALKTANIDEKSKTRIKNLFICVNSELEQLAIDDFSKQVFWQNFVKKLHESVTVFQALYKIKEEEVEPITVAYNTLTDEQKNQLNPKAGSLEMFKYRLQSLNESLDVSSDVRTKCETIRSTMHDLVYFIKQLGDKRHIEISAFIENLEALNSLDSIESSDAALNVVTAVALDVEKSALSGNPIALDAFSSDSDSDLQEFEDAVAGVADVEDVAGVARVADVADVEDVAAFEEVSGVAGVESKTEEAPKKKFRRKKQESTDSEMEDLNLLFSSELQPSEEVDIDVAQTLSVNKKSKASIPNKQERVIKVVENVVNRLQKEKATVSPVGVSLDVFQVSASATVDAVPVGVASKMKGKPKTKKTVTSKKPEPVQRAPDVRVQSSQDFKETTEETTNPVSVWIQEPFPLNENGFQVKLYGLGYRELSKNMKTLQCYEVTHHYQDKYFATMFAEETKCQSLLDKFTKSLGYVRYIFTIEFVKKKKIKASELQKLPQNIYDFLVHSIVVTEVNYITNLPEDQLQKALVQNHYVFFSELFSKFERSKVTLRKPQPISYREVFQIYNDSLRKLRKPVRNFNILNIKTQANQKIESVTVEGYLFDTTPNALPPFCFLKINNDIYPWLLIRSG